MSQWLKALTASPNELHPFAKFEGYYARFDFVSGASLLLVLCTIPNAIQEKHSIAVTYVPAGSGNVWQTEIQPEQLRTRLANGIESWSLGLEDDAAQLKSTRGGLMYRVEAGGVSFHAQSQGRTPWSSSSSSPEGFIGWLPLPLHWHVESLASQAQFSLSLPSNAHLSEEDTSGTAIVHQEKNWAHSFPTAHHWIQARKEDSSICLAGGQTMRTEAFLIGYRNKTREIELDVRPPFSWKVLGLSPFMSYTRDWDQRTVHINAKTLLYQIDISASAPRGSFFTFRAPFPEGFRKNYMAQSLRATVRVKVFQRKWPLGGWTQVCEDEFHNAGLEFGGEYFPLRGENQAIH